MYFSTIVLETPYKTPILSFLVIPPTATGNEPDKYDEFRMFQKKRSKTELIRNLKKTKYKMFD